MRNLAAKYNGENPAETAARAAAETAARALDGAQVAAARALDGAARAAEQEQRLQPGSQAKPAGLPFPQVGILFHQVCCCFTLSTFPGRLTFPIPSIPLSSRHLLGRGEPQRLGCFPGRLPPRPPTSWLAPGQPAGPGPGAGLADNDARPGAPWGSPPCAPWHPSALPCCPASSKEAEAELKLGGRASSVAASLPADRTCSPSRHLLLLPLLVRQQCCLQSRGSRFACNGHRPGG